MVKKVLMNIRYTDKYR